jgi:putative copper resistance protein D
MLQLVDLFGYFSVLLRAGTLVFQSLLLGGVLFVLWTAHANTELPGESMAAVESACLRLLRASAIGLAVVQVLYLYVDSAVLMVTAEIGFREVVGASFFVAGTCMLAGALATAVLAGQSRKLRTIALPVVAAFILIASVMTNHAAARITGRPPLIGLTLVHEAATGFWIGGLPFLILALLRAKDKAVQWYLTERFSRMALFSVLAIAISGLFLSIAYIGSLRAIFGTAYGVMVTAKALMLLVLVALGAINYKLVKNSTPALAMPRLRRIIEAEVGIGITVILTAASLTSQPPAVDLVNDTVTPQQIVARMTPTWPRLSYPPPMQEIASTQPAAPVAGSSSPPLSIEGVPLTAKNLADIQESESNHHWMGLVVLAMGLLALLARTGKFKWAEYWPLLLICIAIFIFIRADTESWPIGPQGFWATWLHPEVFQHRLAALVCIGFAAFELRVRRLKLESSWLSLIFPLMCALGGAVLLTHSHSITNVKEELLAELSHVPLGVAAVLAGWARWLEIRLPAENRRIPAWIWPACFVLIGAGLLNYREM